MSKTTLRINAKYNSTKFTVELTDEKAEKVAKLIFEEMGAPVEKQEIADYN